MCIQWKPRIQESLPFDSKHMTSKIIMAGAISVDQFSPAFHRFDFTLGFVYVIATLHYARQWSRP